jgi:hypothetical protein
MKRFVLPLIAIALAACPAFASEPKSAQAVKLVKYVQFERQTGVREDEIFIPPPAQPMPPHRPLHIRVMEFVECPIKPIVEYVQSPNSSLRRLINESEDLRKAREQFQRFWISSTVRPF